MNRSKRNKQLLQKGLLSKEASETLQQRLQKKLKDEEKSQKKEMTLLREELKLLQAMLSMR